MTKKASRQLLSIPEARQLIPWSVRTWANKISRREVSSVKCGRRRFIPVEAIEEIIDAGWAERIPMEGRST